MPAPQVGVESSRSLAALGMACKGDMPLWACLLFPSLPLDVFARAQAVPDVERPLVVGSGGRTPRVVAADAAAHAAGIRAGQLLSAALAFAPELVLRDRDGDAEARALAQLATWALTFTPMAAGTYRFEVPFGSDRAKLGRTIRVVD